MCQDQVLAAWQGSGGLFCPRTSSPVLSTHQGCIICSLSKLRNESELVSEGAVGGVRLILILKNERRRRRKKTQQNWACRTGLVSVWIVVLNKKGDAVLGKHGISRTLYTRLAPKFGLCSWPYYRFLVWLWAKKFCFIHIINSRMRSLVQSHQESWGWWDWGVFVLREFTRAQSDGPKSGDGFTSSRHSELCSWVVSCSIFTFNIRLQSKDRL